MTEEARPPTNAPKDDPRTWGNCIRRSDLPPILNEQCEFHDSGPEQNACLHPARQWVWAPSLGWWPMCFEHADYIASLNREWDEAEDAELGR